MTTALSIIKQALRKGNVIGKGENLDDEQAQDGLTALNSMLSLWSVDGGLIFTETRESFPSTGATSYTIGPGGDFDTVKPYTINAMFARANTIDYSLADNDQRQYASKSYKSIGGIPTGYYFDNNFPLSNIFVFPIPDTTYEIHIYSDKILESFTSLTDDINMPAGYENALVYNLWAELAPEYVQPLTPDLIRLARTSKKAVFNSNTKNDNNVATVDSALTINSDDFNIRRGY